MTTDDPRIIPALNPEPTDEEYRIGLQHGRSTDGALCITGCLAAHRVAAVRAAIEWAARELRKRREDLNPASAILLGLLTAHDAVDTLAHRAVAEKEGTDG